MANREEIREGIIARLDQILTPFVFDHRKQAERIAYEKFLHYLHSQGVVLLKENQELPEGQEWGTSWQDHAYEKSQQDMLKAGFKAVEPILEESDASPD